MRFSEALGFLEARIRDTDNGEARMAFRDIYEIMLRSGLQDGKRWAKKMETVVQYVEAGHYTFCRDDAKKLLNKRVYK